MTTPLMSTRTDLRMPEDGTGIPARTDEGRPGRSPDSACVVRLSLLLPADSPRLSGLCEKHARMLAESDHEIEPITVHRSSMRVIDGMHRIQAAELRGDDTIAVRFFAGSDEEAFIEAVKANTRHGLPLGVAERKAAAVRLLAAEPAPSDRAIGEIVGLAANTVAGIRRSTAQSAQSNGRVGRDGRLRPLHTADRRRRAAGIIAERPHAPLRTIAKEVGLSLGTVADVRRRVQQGRDPVPAGQAPARRGGPARPRPPAGSSQALSGAEAQDVWNQLSRDPALHLTEPGRRLLRLLSSHVVDAATAHAVPTHCAHSVWLLAQQCAVSWSEFADGLEKAQQGEGERRRL